MSFLEIFKSCNLEDDFECYTEEFFIKNDLDTINFSLKKIISNELLRPVLFEQIKLKKNEAENKIASIQIFNSDERNVLKLLFGKLALTKTNLFKQIKNLNLNSNIIDKLIDLNLIEKEQNGR